MILSNLGIALQDGFRYRDDGALLDEAIKLHERAVADCPPLSPDHPGYLSTLASAVLHRFERDHQAADLDRATRRRSPMLRQGPASLAEGAPRKSSGPFAKRSPRASVRRLCGST